MPITKAAKKALRQSKKRRRRNLKVKREIKEIIKKFQNLLFEKKIEEANKFLPRIYKILDKAAKRKIIKKNTASRKKSRLAQALNKLVKETKKSATKTNNKKA